MAREKKPYDLPYWIGPVIKGPRFMAWEQNWVPLFTCHPAEMLAGGHYLLEGGFA
jgi:hypothetical protein